MDDDAIQTVGRELISAAVIRLGMTPKFDDDGSFPFRIPPTEADRVGAMAFLRFDEGWLGIFGCSEATYDVEYYPTICSAAAEYHSTHLWTTVYPFVIERDGRPAVQVHCAYGLPAEAGLSVDQVVDVFGTVADAFTEATSAIHRAVAPTAVIGPVPSPAELDSWFEL